LPDLPRYFEKFADMQYRAVQAVAQSSRPALLEDYALLLKSNSISDLQSIPCRNSESTLKQSRLDQLSTMFVHISILTQISNP
jgi:hypothetical protein